MSAFRPSLLMTSKWAGITTTGRKGLIKVIDVDERELAVDFEGRSVTFAFGV